MNGLGLFLITVGLLGLLAAGMLAHRWFAPDEFALARRREKALRRMAGWTEGKRL